MSKAWDGSMHCLHAAFGRSQIPAVIFTPCCPVIAPKRHSKGQTSRLSATSIPTSHASSAVDDAQVSQVATLSQYDDCELLWCQYGRQLSLSKSAIYWSLQDVQLGALPCNAERLKSRAAGFAALGQQQQVPGLDALRVLNSSRHCLRYEPGFVREVLQQLLQLLPGTPPTQLLLDSLADLDLPPEIVALQHQEADAVFRSSLGAHVTPKAFHHLLQRWRQQHQGQWQQPAGQLDGAFDPGKPPANVQQWHWPVGQSDTAGRTPQRQQQQQQQQQGQPYSQASPVEQAAAEADPGPTPKQQRPLLEQLAALMEVLGPEVVHVAVGSTSELLDADPAGVLANLQWLQQQLRLSPVAAVLMAETAGHVLLLPSSVLEARYSNICYLLLQLLGWKLSQAHTLLCNAPQLLGHESARLASNWQLVQQLARSRSAWLEELANASPSLVIAVLSAEQRQLQQLRYAAEARELQGLGLVQVLRKEYVDFVHACPGFRVWRCLVPAERHRWSVVEAGCIVVPDPVLGAQDRCHLGKVLAADKRGQPVLVQVGDLSPSDRLVG